MPTNPKLSTIAPFNLVLCTVVRCPGTGSAWTFLMPGEPVPALPPPTAAPT